jgi:3-hydroxyisobutyrate dehydrogenase-like beta-hydroxyacid dehydrogenase
VATAKIAFIGTGVIGYPVAGHLAKNGHAVTVHNRSAAKAEKWMSEYPGKVAYSPAQASEDVNIAFLCVGNDDDVRDVILGKDGILSTLQEGSLIVDHTTASAQVAQEMAEEAAKKRIGFLDAPVSGGETGAINGKLSIMVGGIQTDFDKALPLMSHYGAAVNLMGPVGSGQLTKMVNQICIASTVQGLSEAIHFGRTAGLDMEKVLSVISKGAAQSWQLENRGPTILQEKFDFGFAVDLIRKDLGICVDEARAIGATLPVTAILEQFYANLQRQGKGKWDFTSLYTLLHTFSTKIE